MQLTVVDPEPSQLSLLQAVAIRMADEGIPVRAIARAVRIPGDEVYDILREAITTGTIVELPKDDWPPGSNRSSRSVFQGTPLEQEDALKFACARVFKATRLEAAILAVLLKRTEVTKQQLHQVIENNRPGDGEGNPREETDPKMVDVLICHLRKKLKLHEITIETVWGIGYLVSGAQRDLAIRKLTTFSVVPENMAQLKEAA